MRLAIVPIVHDANAGTLGTFGGWHAWCSCGLRAVAVGDRTAAEFVVYRHLLDIEDIERAQRYALEKGLPV